MINIIDTYSQIHTLFENETFCPEKWEEYINAIYDNSADVFKDDLKECLDSGAYNFESDILPIIDAVHRHPALEMLHCSFCKVTSGLNEKIVVCFGRELDVDIVLYVGLCNAAGWVTNINGRTVILLGVEKILELSWQDEDSMYGLIYHELGHVYHKQYGVFHQESDDNEHNFVWQLFTEGIAMYFEQVLVNDFDADLPTMTRTNQKYFGDWVKYCGRGDVGYYLGTRFVQSLCNRHSFEQVINMKMDDVYNEYLTFVGAHIHK